MPTAKKSTTRRSQRTSAPRPSASGASSQPLKARAGWAPYAIAAAAAFILAFWVYSPALHGPFLFDDNTSAALHNFDTPLSAWIHGVRPLLMFTYWLNGQLSGTQTYSFHVLNVLFHCFSAALMFFVLRRLLECAAPEQAAMDAARRNLLAGFGTAVFLLHPVQTEAVAYLAGRSDGLSVLLLLAAYAIFLYRRNTSVSWVNAVLVLVFFGASLLAKEDTIVLPALLLLTDYWWNPGFSLKGVRGNWKLYLPLALGAVGGFVIFLPLMRHGGNAGFGMKDLTWYQYFFTECRALFVYPALFLLPIGQSADWDFSYSHTIFEHGAILGLIALLGLAILAWWKRREYRLASFGFFAYLLLMAPTSSILPIRDAVAERRLYLSMLGLLLIVLDLASRLKLDRKVLAAACAVVALILGGVTYARSHVWSSELALWQDTVRSTPANWRAHFHLASAWFDDNRCDLAVKEFENTTKLQPPDYDLLVDWGLAYDCLNQPDNALTKLRQAAALERTAHVYSQIGMIYGKHSQWAQAMEALNTAEKLDPNFAATFVYKGLVHMATNDPQTAVQDYQRALAIDPTFIPAINGLGQAQARLRAATH
jgi:protein O-mannosyl-transferase